MKTPFSAVAAFAALASLVALPSALAEPVQYCRNGYTEGQADFCVGISTYQNATSQSSDVYFSLRVPRSSALGWTAIGTGPAMAGSLMFIVYGDPNSRAGPVVSIRTIDGHHQPHPINSTYTALPSGAEIRILHAKWQSVPKAKAARHEDDPNYPIPPSTPATHTAEIALVCHGCSASPVSVTSHSQPFIWAWNDRQKFDSFPLDARLEMHRHHAGSGGFGTFYVDMARSFITTPDPTAARAPAIRPGETRIGTSDSPIGAAGFINSLRDRPLPRGHGALLGLAFLVLFPLGVVLMRTATGNPFRRHWIVQMVATGLTWLGVAVGTVMTGGQPPRTVHQWIGTVVALGLGLQAVLGWRHHVVFLRIRRRTWISHGHIWIGRLVLIAGWVNVLSGMWLSGHGGVTIGLAAGLVVLEAVGISVWVAQAQKRAARGQTVPGQMEAHALMPRSDGVEDYFSLEMSDDEFDTDEEGDKEGKSEQKERLVKKEVPSAKA